MSALLDAAALLLALGGVLIFVLAPLTAGRAWRRVLPATLELWTAAGLLRLSGEATWSRIATAAAIIGIRRVVKIRRPAVTGS